MCSVIHWQVIRSKCKGKTLVVFHLSSVNAALCALCLKAMCNDEVIHVKPCSFVVKFRTCYHSSLHMSQNDTPVIQNDTMT